VTTGEHANLAAFLERTRATIDAGLERYLPKPPVCPRLLSEAMRYSLFAGGKRLRPTITLAAADAVGGSRSRGPLPGAPLDLALPAACAIEMIHTYSLIHDDLPAMDDDTLRRGKPTLHVVYGDGIAVLAGDGLQAAAFALLAREPADEDPAIVARKLQVLALVAEAAGPAGMVGGQAVDLQAAGTGGGGPIVLDADGLRTMHARKTGAMIRASAVAGAIMAGADAIGKDAADAKPTYTALYGVARSRELAIECAARAREVLVDAGVGDGHLGAIADWVVSRTS
jgi:geranylgeranyl diphosphate synthase type II